MKLLTFNLSVDSAILHSENYKVKLKSQLRRSAELQQHTDKVCKGISAELWWENHCSPDKDCLELRDHLCPPPSYCRARELSLSDETFFPQHLQFTIELEEESEDEDEDEEEGGGGGGGGRLSHWLDCWPDWPNWAGVCQSFDTQPSENSNSNTPPSLSQNNFSFSTRNWKVFLLFQCFYVCL